MSGSVPGTLASLDETDLADGELPVIFDDDMVLQRGLPVGVPSMRTFEITDRLGNGVCAVAVYPVGHAGAGFTS